MMHHPLHHKYCYCHIVEKTLINFYFKFYHHIKKPLEFKIHTNLMDYSDEIFMTNTSWISLEYFHHNLSSIQKYLLCKYTDIALSQYLSPGRHYYDYYQINNVNLNYKCFLNNEKLPHKEILNELSCKTQCVTKRNLITYHVYQDVKKIFNKTSLEDIENIVKKHSSSI